MTKQKEIREWFRDFICRLAKSDETDACESCEKLELKPVCSIRHNAYEYLTYLHSRNCILGIDCPDCKGDGRIQKFLGRTFSNRCRKCNGYGYVAFEPLIKEVSNGKGL